MIYEPYAGLIELPRHLEVKADRHEYEVIINPAWCDIGSHKVSELELMHLNSSIDASVCEGCYEHYT